MKKYCLNPNLTKDEFDDGEVMFYNDLSDEIHILNATAYEVLNLVLNYQDIEFAKKEYLLRFCSECFQEKNDDIENDFEIVINQLIEKNIITKNKAVL